MPSSSANRLSIRVDADRKALIAKAAACQGTTISDFVLDQAYQMALELVADEGQLSLSKRQVSQLFDILDHPPPTSVAAVRKLLKEPSLLDG